MTKTTTVPHLLEQLSVELHANGVKFDTALAYGIPVSLVVSYEPVSEKHDQAHVVIWKALITSEMGQPLFTDSGAVEIDRGTDVLQLIPKSQVAAIEENLLAQMAGE